MNERIPDGAAKTHAFPFMEALNFSILLWTSWGLLEAFYLQKMGPLLHLPGQTVSTGLFLASFGTYLVVAVIATALIYPFVKWLLLVQEKLESNRFRGCTLTLLLAGFFLVVASYSYDQNFAHGLPPLRDQYLLFGGTVLLASVSTVLFYRSVARPGYRAQRYGSALASILVLSLLLSFISFPIFAHRRADRLPQRLDTKASAKELMAYHFLGAVVRR